MSKIRFTGPLRYRLRSFATLNRMALIVGARHLLGQKMAPDWDATMEIGIRFWRAQFTAAMACSDMAQGRALFDSLLTETDDVYDVTIDQNDTPKGVWITPNQIGTKASILYLHGGGYTFNGPISTRFAAMLAHRCKTRLFMPQYRLTPEHAHPAQADDALAAWQFLTQTRAPQDIIVAGDSAGGHMALMLLQTLKARNLAQPSLCVAICPWTDIGARGASLKTSDPFDLVQGWMALKFAEWLDPEGRFGRAALSPISYDFTGLAPIYVQAGGREVLRDMICDFADIQAQKGVDLMFDLWPDMPHNFPAYDSTKASSSAALARISQMVTAAGTQTSWPETLPSITRTASGQFRSKKRTHPQP